VSPGPRAVLVTGGGTGIGAAVARQLAAAGDQVAILGRRAGVLAEVAASTGAADVVCDVSDPGQVAAAVSSVADRFGRLDGLVLNAGAMVPGGVAELSVADWDTLLSDAASYVNGAVIPVDGAGIAVDAGTLPFDPRVEVRRDPAS
jgi:NAD(P)-dependent dehydrogenase (short-subunit alcohol dehydrogenase family)